MNRKLSRRRPGVVNSLRRAVFHFRIAYIFIVSSTVIALAVLGKEDLLRTYGGILYGVPISRFGETTTPPLDKGENLPLHIAVIP